MFFKSTGASGYARAMISSDLNFVTGVVDALRERIKLETDDSCKNLLEHLKEYLEKRAGEFNSISAVNRAAFIDQKVLSVGVGEIKENFSEVTIRPFKGFFSQRLYDICKAFRDGTLELTDDPETSSSLVK